MRNLNLPAVTVAVTGALAAFLVMVVDSSVVSMVLSAVLSPVGLLGISVPLLKAIKKEARSRDFFAG